MGGGSVFGTCSWILAASHFDGLYVAQMDAWGYAAYDVAELSYSRSAEAKRRPAHAALLQMDWIFVRVGSTLWERARKAPL